MEPNIGETLQAAGQTLGIAGQALGVTVQSAEVALKVLTDVGEKVLVLIGKAAKALGKKITDALRNRGGSKAVFKAAIFSPPGAGVYSVPQMNDTQFEKFNAMAKKLRMPYQILSGEKGADLIIVNLKQAPTLESICTHMELSLVKEDVAISIEDADLNKDGVVTKEEAEQVIEQALGEKAQNPTQEAGISSLTASEPVSSPEATETKALKTDKSDDTITAKTKTAAQETYERRWQKSNADAKRGGIMKEARRIEGELKSAKEKAGQEVSKGLEKVTGVGKGR